jgi:hypothetical protein
MKNQFTGDVTVCEYILVFNTISSKVPYFKSTYSQMSIDGNDNIEPSKI